MAERPQIEPFVIKDCALLSIATGRRAQNLQELRDHLSSIETSSVYYHFWGRLLRPRFDDPEYNNDFAAWVAHGLREHGLAERLAVIDPAAFSDLEDLRSEVVDVIDEHLDGTEHPAATRRRDRFHFRRAQTIVFDTGRRLVQPSELAAAVPKLSLGSIYYHFIDGRRRPPRRVDDFRLWLEAFGDRHSEIIARLEAVDPYFMSLAELRTALATALGAANEGPH
jgi:AcrR family transcriptional regulator